MLAEFRSDEILSSVDERMSNLRRDRATYTIGIFDLTGSTKTKLTEGHDIGTRKALRAVLIAKEVIDRHSGTSIKELGDGVLAVFADPLNACLAALEFRAACVKGGLTVCAGLTAGLVDVLSFDGARVDVYGSAVDRAARVASFALPGQVLLDGPLLEMVRSQLLDYSNFVVGSGFKRILKGIGDTELFELSTTDIGLRPYIHTLLRIHEEGRLPIADKVYFVKAARTRVIEVGTGATTFAKFFSGHRPAEFRNYVEQLVAKGVSFTLLLLDPDWPGTALYLNDRNEPKYLDDIRRSLQHLYSERERLIAQGLPGEFSIRLYRSYPSMHALCVDPDDETTGRLLAAPYCYGIARAEAPVIECSRLSNRVLFEKYWHGVDALIRDRSRVTSP